MKNDIDVVLTAIKNNIKSIQHTNPNLFLNKIFIRKLSQVASGHRLFPDSLKKCYGVILLLPSQNIIDDILILLCSDLSRVRIN